MEGQLLVIKFVCSYSAIRMKGHLIWVVWGPGAECAFFCPGRAHASPSQVGCPDLDKTLEPWVPCAKAGHRPGSTTLQEHLLQRQLRTAQHNTVLRPAPVLLWDVDNNAPGNSIITLCSSL